MANRPECRFCTLLAGLTLVGLLVYLLTPVLGPFLAGATLAYLGDPLVDRLEERRVPRTLAVTLVFLGFVLILMTLVLLIIPSLGRQLDVLGTKLPLYLEWLDQHVILRISELLGLDRSGFNVDAMREALKANWQSAGGAARQLLESISRSGLAVIQWLANLIIVPVVTFYLMRDWDLLVARIRDLLPRRQEPVISALAREADEVLGQFLRGQLMVMLGQGGIYATGLWIVGLDFAFLIGMLAGLVSFVPYLGAIVGAGVALVAGYLQFQDWFVLLQVLLVFGIGQAIEGMVLTPLLIGDRLGLHPVAVIFAVLAGGQLFGFVGVLLALPVAAVIMVLLRHSRDEYMRSAWYGRPEGGEDG